MDAIRVAGDGEPMPVGPQVWDGDGIKIWTTGGGMSCHRMTNDYVEISCLRLGHDPVIIKIDLITGEVFKPDDLPLLGKAVTLEGDGDRFQVQF